MWHLFLNLLTVSLVLVSSSSLHAEDATRAREDVYGDPLPPGAIARIGSLQWRHYSLKDMVLLPDGKTLLSLGGNGVVRYWDVATSKQLRSEWLKGANEEGDFLFVS